MTQKATFAGGCFWCMEAAFSTKPGVVKVTSGYTGGGSSDPSYEEVSSGKTGHYEAVEIIFEAEKISYERLLEIFWHQIDPTDAYGQFADRGTQYKTVIFYHDKQQKAAAEKSKKDLKKSKKFREPIETKIIPFTKFYPAESYHQDYSKKHPVRYKLYNKGSGRKKFIKENW